MGREYHQYGSDWNLSWVPPQIAMDSSERGRPEEGLFGDADGEVRSSRCCCSKGQKEGDGYVPRARQAGHVFAFGESGRANTANQRKG
eukprot:620808-Amorphochlora_amoeboformis.AAC.2